MWIERKCSCFPKPQKLLRIQVEAYGTKQNGEATQAQEEVRTWSAERLTRRRQGDCHGTWRQGGADWGRSRWNCERSWPTGRQNSREVLIQNQKLQMDDPGGSSQREILAIFCGSGSTELQTRPSEWFGEVISVILLQKCSVKKINWRWDRLTRT